MHDKLFPYKRWFWRGFRASLIIGLLASMWAAWKGFETYISDVNQVTKREIGYNCAARQSDNDLLPLVNEFGTINVKVFGCSDRDFFVSMHEVKDVQSRKMKFETSYSPFYPIDIFAKGVFGFLISIFFTSLTLITVATVRWAWGSDANAERR